MRKISAESPVDEIPMVGASYANRLQNLNIFTIKDFLFHIPSRYQDTSNLSTIDSFVEIGEGTFLARLEGIQTVYTRSRKVFTKAKAIDDTGSIDILWFNQPYLEKALKEDEEYIIDGKVSKKNSKVVIYNPKYELYKGALEKQTHLGKLTTVYPETRGLSSKWIRSRMNFLKKDIRKVLNDPLEESLDKNDLKPLSWAIEKIHFPENTEDIKDARKRLAFDEMMRIAFKIEENIKENISKKSFNQNLFEKDIKTFVNSLPYNLTDAQVDSYKDILEDLSKSTPMNRLLNGDVGSGKTVVAAIAILNTILNKKSAVLMAPTTVLAQQHFDTFKDLFRALNISLELCISSSKNIKGGGPKLIIGTHAILYKKDLDNVGLLIVDEEHRFGVKQRKEILDRENLSPHFLSMTATPIPRSLTKLIYGEIDVSIIKSVPKERIPIKTYFTPYKKRESCFEWVLEKIEKDNDQAFLIYPLIEESEKISARSVTEEFEKLKRGVFKNLNVGLLHGRIKEKEKQEILSSFRDRKLDVLISTSVIEVGIDIPNATIIVIENAERFGLAQLHQLRGRVGRGDKESYCFVIPGEDISEDANDRLRYFSEHNSGFDVAEYDLERRGPGEVYGLKQSGIPQFKVARLDDFKLLKDARELARELVKEDNGRINNIKEDLFR